MENSKIELRHIEHWIAGMKLKNVLNSVILSCEV